MTERGSASVLSSALVGLVLVVGVGAVSAAGAVVAKAAVDGAADAAALAAVSPVVDDPCGAAAMVARRHGVALVACDARGARSHVVVERAVDVPFLGPIVVRGQAAAERDV